MRARLLETAFESDFPGFAAVRTSRAAAGLYLAFELVKRECGPGEVIVPATICPSVPLAAIYAGMKVRFCDVEAETFCLSERTVRAVLGPRTRAIVAAHIFGRPAPVDSLAELARKRGLVLVEDVAHAPGGRLGGRLLGSFGHFAVFSFGESKVLKGSAGILLVGSGWNAKLIRRLERGLPRARDARGELALSFRNVSTGLQDLLRFEGRSARPLTLLGELAPRYRALFLTRAHHDGASLAHMVSSYAGLPAERQLRRRNYLAYSEGLAPSVEYLRFEEEDTCWRLPVLVRDHERQLDTVQAIREAGGLASNLYFAASALFGDAGCRTARSIGERIVNVCVDAKADPALIPWTCHRLNDAAGERLRTRERC
jgi:dTDP-4-amino-4,6-dideoxygalactose transaminase